MQRSNFKNGLNEADVPYEMNKICVIEPEGCWEVIEGWKVEGWKVLGAKGNR